MHYDVFLTETMNVAWSVRRYGNVAIQCNIADAFYLVLVNKYTKHKHAR